MDKKPKLGDLAQALMNLKWSEVVNLTVRLNVPFATLQKIEEDNAAGVRLLVALDAWLKSDRKASWKKVVRVLKELGMDVLAQEVEEKCKKLAEAGSESEEEEDRACSPAATTRTPPPTQCASGLEVSPNAGLHGGIPASRRSPAGRISPARQISPAGRISQAVPDVGGAEEARLLMEMHDALLPAQTKSRFLGLRLGLPPYNVDSIVSQFRDPKEQLLEVLKVFLTTVDPSEAWSMVAEALRSKAIGLPRVAKSIEDKYCSPPTHLTPHSSHNTPSSSHSTPHISPSSHLTPHSSHNTPSSHSTPHTSPSSHLTPHSSNNTPSSTTTHTPPPPQYAAAQNGRTGKLDINKDLGPAKAILECHLNKEQLKNLFRELGLANKTLLNHFDNYGVSEYAEDLVRAWINGRDDVLKKPEYPGGATWDNLRKALDKEGHGEAALQIKR